MTKEAIANHINKICNKASCFVCAEADKYEHYEQCPYIKLKQLARKRKVLPEDIPEELIINNLK